MAQSVSAVGVLRRLVSQREALLDKAARRELSKVEEDLFHKLELEIEMAELELPMKR